MVYRERFKLVTFLLAITLILSNVIVFADNTDVFAVEILGSGVENELKLTLEDLKSMPDEAHIHEEYIYNSKSGQKSVEVKGVSLTYLLKEKAGVLAKNAEVIFETLDGYPVDPQSLEDIMNEDLKYVLAYEIDGKVIDNDDILDNEEIVVYRKVKEQGEFGTVFKLVFKITVGQAIESTKEKPVEEKPVENIVEETVDEITFSDITGEYDFAITAIQELKKKDIIDGIGNGKFAPEMEFTRAQFCKIMVLALEFELGDYSGEFTDVKANNWYAPYVEAAIKSGLFIGYTDNSFRPDQAITRQEMAAVVGRGAVLAELVEQARMEKFVIAKSNFKDKDLVPSWAENEVAWLEAQGVFSEIAKENFEPTKVVNRAEAAFIVYTTLFGE